MDNPQEWIDFDRMFGSRPHGYELLPIMAAEDQFTRQVIDQRSGRSQLVESTLGFTVASVLGASRRLLEAPNHPKSGLVRILLAWYAAHLRRFRAAEIVFHAGYPTTAVSLLRDVAEWALSVGALQQHVLTWHALHGGPMEVTIFPNQEVEKGRRKASAEAQKMIRHWATVTDIDADDCRRLKEWFRFSHYETHGSLLTVYLEMRSWLLGTGPLLFAPEPEERAVRLYTSRSIEVGQLLLRLLPILQVDKANDEDWAARWHCLDSVYSLEWRPGRGVAQYKVAFGRMVHQKLPFQPETTRLEIK